MKKVLVIDDDQGNREIVTEVLSCKGFEVVAVESCIPVEEVVKLDPDLAILDHYLLGQRGGEFCLELKQNIQSKYLPIILMSAGTHLKEISETGLADGFLEKPFDISDLEEIVNKFVR